MKTPQEIINSKLKSRERVTLRFHISIGSIAQGVGDTTERETVREGEREREIEGEQKVCYILYWLYRTNAGAFGARLKMQPLLFIPSGQEQ